MIVYDKLKIREALSSENIFELLTEWGGEPSQEIFGYVSSTICHNPPREGSRKLYYYENTGLFRCYTGCGEYFDVFELTVKVAKIQWGQEYDLNDAVRWIAKKFNILGEEAENPEEELEDWKYLANYDRIQDIVIKDNSIILKEYETDILDRLNYTVKISPWLQEGISEDALRQAHIGFYPGGD